MQHENHESRHASAAGHAGGHYPRLLAMARMYPSKAINAGVAVASLLVMLLCWVGIRQQVGISDQQFVRSMIPHHAGALLMCQKNRLQNPDLKQLCGEIIRSQQAEIKRMKAAMR